MARAARRAYKRVHTNIWQCVRCDGRVQVMVRKEKLFAREVQQSELAPAGERSFYSHIVERPCWSRRWYAPRRPASGRASRWLVPRWCDACVRESRAPCGVAEPLWALAPGLLSRVVSGLAVTHVRDPSVGKLRGPGSAMCATDVSLTCYCSRAERRREGLAAEPHLVSVGLQPLL